MVWSGVAAAQGTQGGGQGPGARWGTAHAWCAKSGCSAGDQRRYAHDAWSPDPGASAEYIAATVGSDTGSGRHIAATLYTNTGYEHDASADGRSEPAQLCDQRA